MIDSKKAVPVIVMAGRLLYNILWMTNTTYRHENNPEDVSAHLQKSHSTFSESRFIEIKHFIQFH